MEVGGQRHAPARFTPGKETRYPLFRRLGGPQERSGRVRKYSSPPGFNPRTAQPVASRYTDWAIPAHTNAQIIRKICHKLSLHVSCSACFGECSPFSGRSRHKQIYRSICLKCGSRWRSRLRHCAGNQKGVHSIAGCVTGMFRWHNPSGRTVALESIQSLTERVPGIFNGVKGGRCLGLTTLPPSCVECSEIWEPQLPGNCWNCSKPVQGLLYSFYKVKASSIVL